MKNKKSLDAKTHPDPGRNCKRQFISATMDINKSPVNFEKYSYRKAVVDQHPKYGAHDKRFEPMVLFPAVASKYSQKSINMVHNFDHQ